MNKPDVVRSIAAERARTLGLLRPLSDDRFDVPTALPGWRVREVVAHLITTDQAAVTGAILSQVFGSMDKLEAWNEKQVAKWRDRPVRDMLLALDRWGRRFAAFARAFPAPMYRLRLPSVLGRGEAGMLVWIRAYDEWIHRQDIRRAFGMPDEDVDLESVAQFLLRAIAASTSPNVEGPPGARVAISLEQVPLPEWGYELGTRTNGADLAASATSRILARAPAFVMAAAGRDPFDALEREGLLKIEGEEAPARRLLAKLRIV